MRLLICALPLCVAMACGSAETGGEAGGGAEAPAEAPAKEAGLSCDVVAKHVVDVLHGELGDDSFLKPADVPKLVEGCKKADNLKSDPSAQCIADAANIAAMEACGKKSLDKLIMPWMK